jgi:hypothetical protein
MAEGERAVNLPATEILLRLSDNCSIRGRPVVRLWGPGIEFLQSIWTPGQAIRQLNHSSTPRFILTTAQAGVGTVAARVSLPPPPPARRRSDRCAPAPI